MNNKNSEIVSLPFIETIRRSFLYTVFNWELLAKIMIVGLISLVPEFINGFPSLCSLSAEGCQGSSQQTLFNFLLLVASVAALVNYSRSIILKTPVDFVSWGFWRRSIKYIFASIGLTFVIITPFLLLAGIYAAVFSAESEALIYLLLIVPLIAWMVWLSPVFLYFAGITVDDKKMTIKEAFRLCKGNRNKIFWGQSLMMLPCAIGVLVLTLVYQIFTPEIYISKMIYAILLVTVSFLDTCFKASFFAHIYQFFTFYNKSK